MSNIYIPIHIKWWNSLSVSEKNRAILRDKNINSLSRPSEMTPELIRKLYFNNLEENNNEDNKKI